MKVEILLSKWYAKGNVEIPVNADYSPRLENEHGQRCCLGFCALKHIPQAPIVNFLSPKGVFHQPTNWMVALNAGELENSPLAESAMEANDASSDVDFPHNDFSARSLPERMGFLITVFAEGGDDLHFICDEA